MQEATPIGPLQHVRVLDFTGLLQGPLATQILGDFGADVVKFERPEGEWMRHWGILMARTHGETDAFLAFNRNKRSVALDLREPSVIEGIKRLIPFTDVVVENFRPGVMDRLGLGFNVLSEINPQLVYAASSGYGQSGPYAKRPGQDMLVQALSGSMWLNGTEGGPPQPMGVAIADQFTALHIVIGILAALESRRQTGLGQRVDLDLLSCMLAAQQQELTVYLNHGDVLRRPARNVGHVGITAPSGVYQTADGYLTLGMFNCPRLGEILGVDWLAEYDTNEKMFDARDEVYDKLSQHFQSGSTDRWMQLLADHDVWCAPVQTHAAVETDPQIRHQGIVWQVPYGSEGPTYRTIGSPFKFSRTPAAIRRPTPKTGDSTQMFTDGVLEREWSE